MICQSKVIHVISVCYEGDQAPGCIEHSAHNSTRRKVCVVEKKYIHLGIIAYTKYTTSMAPDSMLRQSQAKLVDNICLEGDQVSDFIRPPTHQRYRLMICGVEQKPIKKINQMRIYTKIRQGPWVLCFGSHKVIKDISICYENDQAPG